MPLTASFSEARINFTQITDMVMNDRVQVTVFKRNKPAFKIVPIDADNTLDIQEKYLAADEDLDREYRDVFERLSK
ncbi:MAG: type II toxin-antitoxin system prevent-host-death family antitoxin [Raoultibacter sp.]